MKRTVVLAGVLACWMGLACGCSLATGITDPEVILEAEMRSDSLHFLVTNHGPSKINVSFCLLTLESGSADWQPVPWGEPGFACIMEGTVLSAGDNAGTARSMRDRVPDGVYRLSLDVIGLRHDRLIRLVSDTFRIE